MFCEHEIIESWKKRAFMLVIIILYCEPESWLNMVLVPPWELARGRGTSRYQAVVPMSNCILTNVNPRLHHILFPFGGPIFTFWKVPPKIYKKTGKLMHRLLYGPTNQFEEPVLFPPLFAERVTNLAIRFSSRFSIRQEDSFSMLIFSAWSTRWISSKVGVSNLPEPEIDCELDKF